MSAILHQALMSSYHVSGGGATDPNFSSVVLLMPFNGANGSQTFTDVTGRVWTPELGTAPVITTVQSVFGGASMDATIGRRLFSTVDVGLQLGTGDFTIEYWHRFTNNNLSRTVIQVNGGWAAIINSSNNILLQRAPGQNLFFTSPNARTIDTWRHFAFVRSGNTFRCFVDGTQCTEVHTNTGSMTATLGNQVAIGASATSTLSEAAGFIDDLRVTKGVARYTANFTPPTVPFPTS